MISESELQAIKKRRDVLKVRMDQIDTAATRTDAESLALSSLAGQHPTPLEDIDALIAAVESHVKMEDLLLRIIKRSQAAGDPWISALVDRLVSTDEPDT